MRTMGSVKWFDPKTGEGCVVSEGGSQAVLPAQTLRSFASRAIKPGAALCCEVKLRDGVLCVTEIYRIEGERPARASGDEGVRKVKALQSPKISAQGTAAKWFSPVKSYGYVVVTKTAPLV